jgi:hypothetical protein
MARAVCLCIHWEVGRAGGRSVGVVGRKRESAPARDPAHINNEHFRHITPLPVSTRPSTQLMAQRAHFSVLPLPPPPSPPPPRMEGSMPKELLMLPGACGEVGERGEWGCGDFGDSVAARPRRLLPPAVPVEGGASMRSFGLDNVRGGGRRLPSSK